jgi:hypothetical protein
LGIPYRSRLDYRPAWRYYTDILLEGLRKMRMKRDINILSLLFTSLPAVISIILISILALPSGHF